MQVSPLEIILWTSAWTALGWLASDKLAIGRESRFRRGAFRSFLQQQLNRIESLSLNEIAFASPEGFPRDIKRFAEVEKEFIAVEQHLCRRRRKLANAAFSEYRRTGYEIGQPEKCEAVKAKLLSLLEDLANCAR